MLHAAPRPMHAVPRRRTRCAADRTRADFKNVERSAGVDNRFADVHACSARCASMIRASDITRPPTLQRAPRTVQQKTPIVQQKTPIVQQKTPIVQQKTPIVQQKNADPAAENDPCDRPDRASAGVFHTARTRSPHRGDV